MDLESCPLLLVRYLTHLRILCEWIELYMDTRKHGNNHSRVNMRLEFIICIIYYRCTDINHRAAELARKLSLSNGHSVEPVLSDLVNLRCYSTNE